MTNPDPKSLAANATQVYQEGDFENAARLFGEAASAFQAAGSSLDFAEMKNNQSVAFLQNGDAQASFEAAHDTAEVFAAAGDSRREGMAFGNEASALEALHRSDDALRLYRLAADALEKAEEDQLRASVMQALAGIQLRKGKILEALLSMQVGLAGVKQPTLKQRISSRSVAIARMVNLQIAARTARPSDHAQIANLIYFEPYVHRHLDWRAPLDWLGAPQYWVLEQFGIISGALACPPDPPGVAWLRLFAINSSVPLPDAWASLWATAKTALQGQGLLVAAITIAEWLKPLLVESGFKGEQEIVVLEQNMAPFQEQSVPPEILIRPMSKEDLSAVAAVDAAAFTPLWQNSLAALRLAFTQAGFASVAQIGTEIVGYQISTKNAFGAHLARLAVSPQFQGRSIGYLLVQSLLRETRRAGLFRLTVNTQNDNHASLALYQKIGFEPTGERYTVFSTQL